MRHRALFGTILILAAACGDPVSYRADDLVGSWRFTEHVQSVFYRDLEYAFGADGTYVTSVPHFDGIPTSQTSFLTLHPSFLKGDGILPLQGEIPPHHPVMDENARAPHVPGKLPQLSSVSGRPSSHSRKGLRSLRPRGRFATAVRLTVMLTLGV